MIPSWLSPPAIWFMVGVILMVVELVIGGFLAFFFAVGAWITAILLWIGLIPNNWVALAVFLISSIIAMLLLRRRLKPVLGGAVDSALDTDLKLDDFVGKRIQVIEAIDPDSNTGKVEFRGTHWDARADRRIEAGETVIIVGRNNITLQVKPSKE